MLTKRKVLSKVVDDCYKELYSLVVPHVDWDNFVEENKIYSDKFTKLEEYRRAYYNRNDSLEAKTFWQTMKNLHPEWENKTIDECIGPRPYDFYYLPKEIFNDIIESYIYVYDLDKHKNLLDTIQILKDYCEKPIVDKYIEGELREDGTRWPGYRGYDHPDNLYKEIAKIINNYCIEPVNEDNDEVIEIVTKFYQFLNMAGEFYDWNGDLNSFRTSIYLGATPSSNKNQVIEYWKKYRNQDIEINEEQIKKEYYGEDYEE